jgi:hypothetical protein
LSVQVASMKLILLFLLGILWIFGENFVAGRTIGTELQGVKEVNVEKVPDDPVVKFYEELIAENERVPKNYVQFLRRSRRRSRRSFRRYYRTYKATAATAATTTTVRTVV